MKDLIHTIVEAMLIMGIVFILSGCSTMATLSKASNDVVQALIQDTQAAVAATSK